jgi:hypothetical protein
MVLDIHPSVDYRKNHGHRVDMRIVATRRDLLTRTTGNIGFLHNISRTSVLRDVDQNLVSQKLYM